MTRTPQAPVVRVGCVLLLSLTAPLFSQSIHQVPQDWATIQEALAVASDGDVVEVAPGVYLENLDFLGKAVTLRSAMGPDVTTLDGSAQTRGPIEASVVTFDTGEGPLSRLEGFTITGGIGREDGGYRYGGGVYCADTNPTIENCRFVDLFTNYGSGIAYIEGAPWTVIGCSFEDNLSTLYGAAIYSKENAGSILGCDIRDNYASTGTVMVDHDLGLSDALLHVDQCTFTNNTAAWFGAVTAFDGAVTITDSVFTGNQADIGGGAVALAGADFTIGNCTFIGNAANYGGAVTLDNGTATVERCTFWQNVADLGEGAIGTTANPFELDLEQCTFVDNQAGLLGPSAIATRPSTVGVVRNCILRGSGPMITNEGLVVYVFNDVEGGFPGEGNFDLDPGFVDASAGDFRLLPDSPCIDAGHPDSPPDPDGSVADVGRFPLEVELLRRGDANGDGTFSGLADGFFLLLHGLVPGSPAPVCLDAADADDSGAVVGLVDGVYCLNVQFLPGTPPPPPPGPATCGVDPTADLLDCAVSPCGIGP